MVQFTEHQKLQPSSSSNILSFILSTKDKVRFEIVKMMWIVVGCMVPIWVYLSQVYRAPLPYQEISDIAGSFTLGHTLNIYLSVDWKGSKGGGGEDKQDEIIRNVQRKISAALDEAGAAALGGGGAGMTSGRHLSIKAIVSAPPPLLKKQMVAGSYLVQIECDDTAQTPRIVIQVDRKAVFTTNTCHDTSMFDIHWLFSSLKHLHLIPVFFVCRSSIQSRNPCPE